MLSHGQAEYFSTDSLTSVGVKLVDGGDVVNAKFCHVKTGDSIAKYTPYQVKSYGFKNGSVYVSRDIDIAGTSKRVFLECLYQGKVSLYYYKGKKIKTFFIEKDSTSLVEIPRRNDEGALYTEQLIDLTADCPHMAGICKHVSYTKTALPKLVDRYQKCASSSFPHPRFGVIAGYEMMKMSETDMAQFDYTYDGGYSIGLFADIPVLVSAFSLHAEVNFSKHGISYAKEADDLINDLLINVSIIKVPILVRYTFASDKLSPFVNAGAVLAYNTHKDVKLFETRISDDLITIDDNTNESLISDSRKGASAGAGVEYRLDYKHSLFFELRFSKLFGKDKAMDSSDLQLLASFNF